MDNELLPNSPPSLEKPQPPAVKITEPSYWKAYLLLFCLGFLGGHRFYLGKYFTGFLYAISGGFLGFGVALDVFLTFFMVREARVRRLAELTRHPEVALAAAAATDDSRKIDEMPLAPWANQNALGSYFSFPLRLLFFCMAPPMFAILCVMFHQWELLAVMGVILVATGFLSTMARLLKKHPTLERVPVLQDAIGIFKQLLEYYFNNRPSSFLFYLFYPICGPLYFLFSRPVRQEFRLYMRLVGAIVLILIINTIFEYRSLYPPHLEIKDALVTIFQVLILDMFLVVAFMMPMVTTGFSLHLSGKRIQLRVLTVIALLFAIPLGILFYLEERESVPFFADYRLSQRLQKTSFQIELSEISAMFLEYQITQLTKAATPEMPETHPELTRKFQSLVGKLAVEGEAQAFSVIVFSDNGLVWCGIKLSLDQKPTLLYLASQERILYRSWRNVPPAVEQKFHWMQKRAKLFDKIPGHHLYKKIMIDEIHEGQ